MSVHRLDDITLGVPNVAPLHTPSSNPMTSLN